MNEHKSIIQETSNSNKNYYIIKNARSFTNICSHYQATNTNIYYNIFRLKVSVQNNHF